ncbi:MAG: trehalase family glycosidase [Chloroflexota bacterium]|nr:trehalase family glycosidase [Chloroflexota bacterium]
MSALTRLHNRIDLDNIPFTDRGTRLLLFLKYNEISIRLAERWAKWERLVGHYRQRPPIVDRLRILDANGQVLVMTPDTYPHAAGLLTEIGRFEWVFIDPETMMLRLPQAHFTLSYIVRAERGQTDRRGAMFHGKRNVAYTTNATIVSNVITQISDELFEVTLNVDAATGDEVLLINITPRLAYNRAITHPNIVLDEARQRWQAWFDAAPPIAEQYRDHYEYAWWVMRIGLLNTRYFLTREACVPSKIHYVGVWHWDQFFHALAYRHIDQRLAEDQIRIVLDHQREDGMLPDAIHDEGLVTRLTLPVEADVTKPPLAGWAVLKLYEKSGSRDFLEEVYEPLSRWQNWWMAYSRSEGVLCEYRHPFSSGLDDSPLWDDGMPVIAPDLNTYLCLQAESLASIADLIGLPNEAQHWRVMADELAKAMLTTLWDEGSGVFRARHKGEAVNVLTPFNLLPMWVGRYPQAVVARLLAHLQNPDTFWSGFPLPTVAFNDPKFDAKQMWRGPTWVNINYLFIEALTRLGEHELAGDLRRKTLDLIMQNRDIYEYYDPLTAERPPKSAPIFGWTSAVFIDLAIQETAKSHSP